MTIIMMVMTMTVWILVLALTIAVLMMATMMRPSLDWAHSVTIIVQYCFFLFYFSFLIIVNLIPNSHHLLFKSHTPKIEKKPKDEKKTNVCQLIWQIQQNWNAHSSINGWMLKICYRVYRRQIPLHHTWKWC